MAYRIFFGNRTSAATTPVTQTSAINLELIKALTATSVTNDEYGAIVSTTSVENLEIIKAVASQTNASPLEILKGIQALSIVVDEYIKALSILSAIPIEYGSDAVVSQTGVINLEHFLRVATAPSLRLEILQGLANTAIINNEYRGYVQALNATPDEYLGVISRTSDNIQVELLNLLSATRSVPLEYIKALAATSTTPVEYLAALNALAGIPLEHLDTPVGAVSHTAVIPIEYLQALRVNSDTGLEYLAPITRTQSLPVELLKALAASNIVVVEYLNTPSGIAPICVEILSDFISTPVALNLRLFLPTVSLSLSLSTHVLRLSPAVSAADREDAGVTLRVEPATLDLEREI